ncbi:MAG: hypothetical protein AB1758_11150 [Candidatus Eremiobacterota bacterium]
MRPIHSIPIVPHRVQGLGAPVAIADVDGDGAFTEGVDQSVFLRDEDGGGGILAYDDLKGAVAECGGRVTAETLGVRLSGASVGLSRLPAGLIHPMVGVVLRLTEEGTLQMDYSVLESARVLAPEDGNIATVDLDADGRSHPDGDALLFIESHADGRTYRSALAVSAVETAVRAHGGVVEPTDYDAAFGGLAPVPGHIGFSESPARVDSAGAPVNRTFRLDDRGLVVEYSL